MSEQSNKNPGPLLIHVTRQIPAPADIIFSVLLKVPMLWWSLPSIDSFSQQLEAVAAQDRDMVLEAKVGGRLFERWGQQSDDADGALLATVVAMRRPDLLILEGSLGLGVGGLPSGVITFVLTAEGDNTQVALAHQSTQTASAEITSFMAAVWSDFLGRLKAVVAAISAPINALNLEGEDGQVLESGSDDPQILLEQAYQDLQSNLIQVRQAVAQAIATEKQLEQQILKNKDQGETWENRANMAMQQHNADLAQQALARRQQYVAGIPELEEQLKLQSEATATLRQRLTELEGQVQKAYTKKQLLIARNKAAKATEMANEILSRVTANDAFSIINRMEQKVMEREALNAAAKSLEPPAEADN